MSISMEYEPARRPYRSVPDDAWIVTRYEDAICALRSPYIAVPSGADGLVAKVSQRLGGAFDDLAALIAGLPILENPPDHAPSRDFLRDIVRAMSATYTPEKIDEAASELLQAAAIGDEIDVIPQLCYLLPDTLLGEALGFSPGEISDMRAAGAQVIDDWRPAMPLREYENRQTISKDLRRRLADRWDNHGCPVLNGRRAMAEIAARICDEKRDAALLLLIVLANDTMAAFLGNVLHLLANRPELQETLRKEPQRMNAFVEEALRYCGPIRQRSRIAAGGDLDLDGVTIPRGATLHIKIESASRDPEVYPEPDLFNLDRQGPPVLAFGAGPHICGGAVFARLVAKRFLMVLLEGFSLHPGAAAPRLAQRREVRQFASLPLCLQAV